MPHLPPLSNRSRGQWSLDFGVGPVERQVAGAARRSTGVKERECISGGGTDPGRSGRRRSELVDLGFWPGFISTVNLVHPTMEVEMRLLSLGPCVEQR